MKVKAVLLMSELATNMFADTTNVNLDLVGISEWGEYSDGKANKI